MCVRQVRKCKKNENSNYVINLPGTSASKNLLFNIAKCQISQN